MMNRYFAPLALAVIALALLFGALIARAAQQPAQPYPPGTILTVAGNGHPGFSGDGGPATKARLAEAIGLAIDATGTPMSRILATPASGR
jgi:hypothetical protein